MRKEISFIERHPIKTAILLVILSIIVGRFGMRWIPESKGADYANYGQWISGIIAVLGVPLLFLTLFLQGRTMARDHQRREDEDRENTFERHCRSIEIGLSYIKNVNANVDGGKALIRYGELCVLGTLDFEKTTTELTVGGLKAVVAALAELLEWIGEQDNAFRFHNFFRVRFEVLIQAFENMLPTDVSAMSEGDLFKKYANDNDLYSLALSIKRLAKKNFEVWADYEAAKEKRVRT